MTHPATTLPTFKYHPDPVATGHVVASTIECVSCGHARGWIYIGPVYSEEEYGERICPWCIADGSAHARLDVIFTDAAGIGGYGAWDEVPAEVIQEVAQRTPGFNGWQQEKWWTHCGDAAAFIGRAGRDELEDLGDDAIVAIQGTFDLSDDSDWEEIFESLDKDGSPTAYMFRCTQCGEVGGYWDSD
jgi:uncharacterized protein CbrC (UPF0167 family)